MTSSVCWTPQRTICSTHIASSLTQVILDCKKQVCKIFHALFDAMVETTVHRLLGMLRQLVLDHADNAKKVVDGAMGFIDSYLASHEMAGGLIDIPRLLNVLLDLACAEDHALSASVLHLVFRLYSYRSEVCKHLQEVPSFLVGKFCLGLHPHVARLDCGAVLVAYVGNPDIQQQDLNTPRKMLLGHGAIRD